MLDSKFVYTNIELVKGKLATRGLEFDDVRFQILFENLREEKRKLEKLQNERNSVSDEFAKAKINKDEQKQQELANVSDSIARKIAIIKPIQENAEKQLEDFLLEIPNLPLDEVVIGKDETENKEIKKWGEPTIFSFVPKDHIALGEGLKQMDFEFATKISGSRFSALSGDLARLHRALIQFMLQEHQKAGYDEYYLPQLVSAETMRGTGQLPKFKSDIFEVEGGKWYLIPTAEVPLTNLVAGEMLDVAKLPMKITSHTACFRSEAGSYGKDTKGLIRLHQFDKVELVHLTTKEDSLNSLEEMVSQAEHLLELLKIPYRRMLLCTGDMGFCSAKTYDLEVWLPAQDKYREISSCSVCSDFQARRMNAKYKDKDGSKNFIHTLNGSGLAVGRTLVAVLENYQNEDGSITIPEVLRPFMGGKEKIAP